MDKKKLLVIEEDLFLANIYKVKLEREGFEVKIAHGGEQGLEMYKEYKPDIVLMEIMLARIDGFELLQMMKKESGGKAPCAVYLTKLGEKEDVERGLENGASAYFIKTQVTFQEVVSQINELACML